MHSILYLKAKFVLKDGFEVVDIVEIVD